jgi:hypothetical protein
MYTHTLHHGRGQSTVTPLRHALSHTTPSSPPLSYPSLSLSQTPTHHSYHIISLLSSDTITIDTRDIITSYIQSLSPSSFLPFHSSSFLTRSPLSAFLPFPPHTCTHLSGSAVHGLCSPHTRSLASHLLTASRSSNTDYSDTRLPQVYATFKDPL